MTKFRYPGFFNDRVIPYLSMKASLFYRKEKNGKLPGSRFSSFIHARTKKPEFTVDCSGPAKSFVTDVSPVFQTSCTINSGCHGTGSGNGHGPLLNYSQIFVQQ